jgi:hypothetical protein
VDLSHAGNVGEVSSRCLHGRVCVGLRACVCGSVRVRVWVCVRVCGARVCVYTR